MKRKGLEKAPRSVVKSITYRVLSIAADTIAAYFFTRSTEMTFFIVLIVNGYSTILYYFHERIWAHVRWGRRKEEECYIC